jgi:galacturan 1,4-alpha-galacturonidase
MPFVFWNVSEITVKNFYVKDPPLWAINIMNGTNMIFDNIRVTATATQQPWGANWAVDTDGFSKFDLICSFRMQWMNERR